MLMLLTKIIKIERSLKVMPVKATVESHWAQSGRTVRQHDKEATLSALRKLQSAAGSMGRCLWAGCC